MVQQLQGAPPRTHTNIKNEYLLLNELHGFAIQPTRSLRTMRLRRLFLQHSSNTLLTLKFAGFLYPSLSTKYKILLNWVSIVLIPVAV